MKQKHLTQYLLVIFLSVFCFAYADDSGGDGGDVVDFGDSGIVVVVQEAAEYVYAYVFPDEFTDYYPPFDIPYPEIPNFPDWNWDWGSDPDEADLCESAMEELVELEEQLNDSQNTLDMLDDGNIGISRATNQEVTEIIISVIARNNDLKNKVKDAKQKVRDEC